MGNREEFGKGETRKSKDRVEREGLRIGEGEEERGETTKKNQEEEEDEMDMENKEAIEEKQNKVSSRIRCRHTFFSQCIF